MGQVVTYKNADSECYCQIKLDDKSRILISIAQKSICIYKMKWFGAWPSEKLFEFSLSKFIYSKYPTEKQARDAGFPAPLDILRDILLKCGSLDEVKTVLSKIVKKVAIAQLEE